MRVAGRGFTGLLPYGVQDGVVYLSWMQEAAAGRCVFSNRFTTDPQNPHNVNLLYQALGRVAGLLGGSYGARVCVYHAARVLFAAAFLLLVYLLAAQFLVGRRERLVAMMLAGTASGLGWLAAGLPAALRPLDYAGPLARSAEGATVPSVLVDAVPFLGMLHYPHFALSLALMAGLFLGALYGLRDGSRRGWIAAGAAGFFLANAHTYDWAVAATALTLAVAAGHFRRRDLAGLGMFLALSLPMVAFELYLIHVDPVWRQKSFSAMHTPSPVRLLLTFGPLLALAVPGAVAAWRSGKAHARLLPLWVAAAFLLAYAPFTFQRRMLEGVAVALALLAAPTVARAGRVVIVGIIAVLALSNVFFVVDNVRALRDAAARPRLIYPPVVLYPDEVAAFDWLAANGRPGDGVLCWPTTALHVPARTLLRTYVGHWSETPDYPRRCKNVAAILNAGTPDRVRADFLRRAGIRYLLLGDIERGFSYRPDQSPLFARRFSQGGTTVYEVVQ